MEHRPFTVNVNCTGNTAVKTALTARNTTGTLQTGNDSITMLVNGQALANAPLFWLENNGARVKLTGNDVFCIATNTPNVCQLRPITDIPTNSPEGDIEATLVFNVTYPQ